jgi:hypothetical protein
MRRLTTMLLLSAAFAGAPVLAQDRADEDLGTTSRADQYASDQGYLREEGVSIKPLVGVVAYKDAFRTDTSRMAYGLALDMNIARWLSDDYQSFYVGPSTGVIFSHLGDPSSNFFGADSSTSIGQSSSNFLAIPANLKVGYAIGNNFRVGAHGGGNVIYRTVADAMFLSTDTTGSGSNWHVFPNVGADLELGFGRNVALTIRPDFTITPEDDLFIGSLALGIALG